MVEISQALDAYDARDASGHDDYLIVLQKAESPSNEAFSTIESVFSFDKERAEHALSQSPTLLPGYRSKKDSDLIVKQLESVGIHAESVRMAQTSGQPSPPFLGLSRHIWIDDIIFYACLSVGLIVFVGLFRYLRKRQYKSIIEFNNAFAASETRKLDVMEEMQVVLSDIASKMKQSAPRPSAGFDTEAGRS